MGMEVKSKTKIAETKDKATSFEALIESTDLVKEMYFSLKKQKNKLTPEQILWMNKVEDTFHTPKLTEADIICTLLQNTYDYLNKTKKWSEGDKYAYEMFEKIVFLKSKDGIFQDFSKGFIHVDSRFETFTPTFAIHSHRLYWKII